jgi:hypothetical protein
VIGVQNVDHCLRIGAIVNGVFRLTGGLNCLIDFIPQWIQAQFDRDIQRGATPIPLDVSIDFGLIVETCAAEIRSNSRVGMSCGNAPDRQSSTISRTVIWVPATIGSLSKVSSSRTM